MAEHEITLDSLMQSAQLPITQEQSQDIAQEVTETVNRLTPEEMAQVEKIKQDINLQDSSLLTVYGSQPQKNIAQFSEQILSEVRSKDAGEVGGLMSDLMVKVQDMDISEIEGQGNFISKFFRNRKRDIQSYLAKYDVLSVQIDKIQSQLENARMELLKDISTFDKLYKRNVDYFNELELYIVAGEEKIKETRQEVLPRLQEEAAQSGDAMAAQVVKDFSDSVDRFEKKIYDLKTSKTIAIQTAPQIKLIQNNDKLLVDKVSDAIVNTIPLWKSQVVIALGMNKQHQVLEMQREVSDTTNELLRRNAEKLKQNTIGVAKEAERSTVDIDTLKKVNDDLISTIKETLEIQNNAKKVRAQAEEEMVKIEHELQQALVEAARS